MNDSLSWQAASATCLHCGSLERRHFSAPAHDVPGEAAVQIVECSACQFAWQYPQQRSASQSAEVFDAAYVGSEGERAGYFKAGRRAAVASVEADFLATLPVSGKRLLDVGGGDGAFARGAAGRGWQVTAIDPALRPQTLADTSVRALRGTTAALGADERFDVVTIWDVVEHVEDPAAFLRELRSLVEPGGWLVVETGNYKCLERARSGTGHWIYQLDHRWYFAPESLAALLARTGWVLEREAQRVLRPDWRGSRDAAAPGWRSLLKGWLRQPWQTGALLQRHTSLREAALWPASGLEIFCLAARRPF